MCNTQSSSQEQEAAGLKASLALKFKIKQKIKIKIKLSKQSNRNAGGQSVAGLYKFWLHKATRLKSVRILCEYNNSVSTEYLLRVDKE